MRVLAFRHVPFEGLGLIEDALGRGGIDCECVESYAPGAAFGGCNSTWR